MLCRPRGVEARVKRAPPHQQGDCRRLRKIGDSPSHNSFRVQRYSITGPGRLVAYPSVTPQSLLKAGPARALVRLAAWAQRKGRTPTVAKMFLAVGFSVIAERKGELERGVSASLRDTEVVCGLRTPGCTRGYSRTVPPGHFGGLTFEWIHRLLDFRKQPQIPRLRSGCHWLESRV